MRTVGWCSVCKKIKRVWVKFPGQQVGVCDECEENPK